MKVDEEEQKRINSKALKKLGLKLRRLSEKFLASVGRNDSVTQQIDFTVADAQSLVAALTFEKAYFVRLAVLFGDLSGESVSADMVAAQQMGASEGVAAADRVFKELGIKRNGNERPA